jgi:O-methyltransferase
MSSTPLKRAEQLRKQVLKHVAAPLRKHGRFESMLKVTRLRGKEPSMQHQVIVPHATYSPWWTDTDFQCVLQRVQAATFVDVYRLYELWSLVGQVGGLDGDILEVGVWRGGSGCLMASRARLEGIDATVYLCDTFEGVVKAGTEDNEYRGGEHADTSARIVSELAGRLDLSNVKILQGIFPDDTAGQVASNTFRLCHIDVDVYQSARDVFDWVWDRLVPGGVVVFDDYGFYSCEGVARFVNEMAKRSDLLYLHNLNGHAVLVKR